MNIEYLTKVRELLDFIENTQLANIDAVSKVCAEAIEGGHMLYFFGTGHSHMIAEEPFYRAGGLAAVSPILKNFLMLNEGAAVSSVYERLEGVGTIVIDSTNLSEGDVLFVISNSGRNAGSIDAALRAKEKGATTVAITNMNHSTATTSRHPSGKKLYEVCDYVLDNGGDVGDASLTLPGLNGQKIAPTSTVIDCTLVNMVTTATIEKLLAMGVTPPLYTSANTDEGDRKNAAILAEYKKKIPIL